MLCRMVGYSLIAVVLWVSGLPAEQEPVDADSNAAADALQTKRGQLARLQAEVRELEQQTGLYERVMVQCRFIEADRSILQRLNLDQDDGTLRTSAGSENLVRASDLDEAIAALRSTGDAKLLASRSFSTENGRQGCVFDGGEFPILAPNPRGAHIEWREFGERVTVTPTVLGGGRIRLIASVERSIRDFSNAVTLNGMVVPGLTVRRIQTQLEFGFDQAAVLFWGASSPPPDDESATPPEAVKLDRIVLIALTAEPIGTGE